MPDERLGATKEITFYFVSPKNIAQFKLHPNLKGMSTIDAPSAEVLRVLKQRKLTHLLVSARVPTTSYKRLVASATSVGFVKLDIEGGEPGLLKDLAAECARRRLCPDRLLFEHKYFIGRSWHDVVGALRKVGYTCQPERYDTSCTFDAAYAAQSRRRAAAGAAAEEEMRGGTGGA